MYIPRANNSFEEVTGIQGKREREREWETGMEIFKILIIHRILHQ